MRLSCQMLQFRSTLLGLRNQVKTPAIQIETYGNEASFVQLSFVRLSQYLFACEYYYCRGPFYLCFMFCCKCHLLTNLPGFVIECSNYDRVRFIYHTCLCVRACFCVTVAIISMSTAQVSKKR